jgi:hypothetical protein
MIADKMPQKVQETDALLGDVAVHCICATGGASPDRQKLRYGAFGAHFNFAI